ncbi:hypothetical protein [Actinoplanes utahensis]|uniref:Polysaccharide chain length determinant N-terminal domain-containing protein n=1 Tax=Actinoplanes utahensis TaxID=1869 RepID=A0A0A6UGD6_ACTUT|nr:hypothetical protein [Actinoplanes utahensis]KHD73364.1 hypothetical protein MB27_34590 [Actinoplanes utahensis]GIF30112.1 hypothetical protein Aut01nite_30980 [Actinoplanes utahensis]
MFLSDMAGVLKRRWYVILAGAVITAASVLPAARTQDRFLASEVLMIQPPVSHYAPNPVTGLYPSIAITAAAVANRLNTADSQEMFRSKGVIGTYRFEPRNTGTRQQPRYVIGSMSITNISTDEEGGLHSIKVLRTTFEQELDAMQDEWKVKRDLRITVAPLVPPSSTLLTHSPIRSVMGVGLIGMLVTAAVAMWTDEFARRRRRTVATPLSSADSPHWTEPLVRSAL